jgi:hypothetical protein
MRSAGRRVLMGKPEGKTHLEEPRVDGMTILRWIFRKWDGGHGLDWSGSGLGQVAGSCKCSNEPSGSKAELPSISIRRPLVPNFVEIRWNTPDDRTHTHTHTRTDGRTGKTAQNHYCSFISLYFAQTTTYLRISVLQLWEQSPFKIIRTTYRDRKVLFTRV